MRRKALHLRRARPGIEHAPWRIYNVGNNKPQELLLVLDILEQALGRKAKKEMLPMQPGDVPTTYADVDDLVRDVGFRPATPIEDGIHQIRELVSRLLRGIQRSDGAAIGYM